MSSMAYDDQVQGRTPIFYVMDFELFYPGNATLLSASKLVLKNQHEIRYDEIMDETTDFDQRTFLSHSRIGEHRWFGIEKYIVRLR